jgi:hypothetical protein
MLIIGCDIHTRFQQIAMLDPTTGEVVERRLGHETGEAEKFYASLPGPARVGVEATIRAQWFESALARYGHELWVFVFSTFESERADFLATVLG